MHFRMTRAIYKPVSNQETVSANNKNSLNMKYLNKEVLLLKYAFIRRVDQLCQSNDKNRLLFFKTVLSNFPCLVLKAAKETKMSMS